MKQEYKIQFVKELFKSYTNFESLVLNINSFEDRRDSIKDVVSDLIHNDLKNSINFNYIKIKDDFDLSQILRSLIKICMEESVEYISQKLSITHDEAKNLIFTNRYLNFINILMKRYLVSNFKYVSSEISESLFMHISTTSDMKKLNKFALSVVEGEDCMMKSSITGVCVVSLSQLKIHVDKAYIDKKNKISALQIDLVQNESIENKKKLQKVKNSNLSAFSTVLKNVEMSMHENLSKSEYFKSLTH